MRAPKWQSIIEPLFIDTPFELVGVECSGQANALVRIYIDKPGGINLDDIVRLSREIRLVLDVEQPIKGPYTLEVSSPGLDRPLFLPAHFKEQIGKKITIKVQGKSQKIRGILRDVTDEGIQLEAEQLREFLYTDIDQARLVNEETKKEAKR